MLGNSHTSNIRERGICPEADTLKITAYTVDEANRFVTENNIDKVDVVILHLIANDVKRAEADTVAQNMISLIDTLNTKADKPKVIISLAPHRIYSVNLHEKCVKVNDMLIRYAQTMNNVTICEHTKLPKTSHPDWRKFFSNDGVHLTGLGTATLAFSLRRQVESLLHIAPSPNTYRKPRLSTHNYERTDGPAQRPYHEHSQTKSPNTQSYKANPYQPSWRAEERHPRKQTQPSSSGHSSRAPRHRYNRPANRTEYSATRNTNNNPVSRYDLNDTNNNDSITNSNRYYCQQENIEQYYNPRSYQTDYYRRDFTLPYRPQ